MRSVRTIPRNWADFPDGKEGTSHGATAFKRIASAPLKRDRVAKKYYKPRNLAQDLDIGYSTLLKHIRLRLIYAQPMRKGYRIPDYAVPEYLERLELMRGR